MNDVRELKEEALLLSMENAKLRELCERCAIELYANGNITDAATENLFDDMRELGIEVNDKRNIGGAIDWLLPCPFCGGKAEINDARKFLVVSKFSYIFPYSVKCSNEKCDVKPYTEYSSTEQEAIAAWNRRVQ